MRYLIQHETRLALPGSVREHHCELRLVPVADAQQELLSATVETDPETDLYSYRDCFGNTVHHFDLFGSHEALTTRLSAEVDTQLHNPFDFESMPVAREQEWIRQAIRSAPRLLDFLLHKSDATPNLEDIPELSDIPGFQDTRSLLDNTQNAMHWVNERLSYDPDATNVHSSLGDVLSLKAGVCQDFAHLLISIVRGWGFPARYVMGYLDPGYVEGSVVGAQATHAWTEVLIPGAGWRGFDPTHDLVADDTYIRVACGRDYLDAAPQRGSFKGSGNGEPPQVQVTVTRQL